MVALVNALPGSGVTACSVSQASPSYDTGWAVQRCEPLRRSSDRNRQRLVDGAPGAEVVVEPGAMSVVVVPAFVVDADVDAGDVVAGFDAVVVGEPASAVGVETTGVSVVVGGDRVVVDATVGVVTTGGR